MTTKGALAVPSKVRREFASALSPAVGPCGYAPAPRQQTSTDRVDSLVTLGANSFLAGAIRRGVGLAGPLAKDLDFHRPA
jgi:hypothetical protein